MGLKSEYPDLVNTANDVLFAFRFMYLCDVSFSAMAAIHSCFNMYTLELDFQIFKPTSSKISKPFFITLFIFMRKIGFYTVNKLKYFANFIFIFLIFTCGMCFIIYSSTCEYYLNKCIPMRMCFYFFFLMLACDKSWRH